MPLKPEISVVIPHYNHGNYIGRQVSAIIAQSHPPSEILIVDDSSTDRNFRVLLDLARANCKVRVIRSGGRLGPARAANMGIDLVTSPYVFVGAADDWILPGFFEECAGAFALHPEAGICCGDAIFLDEQTGFQWRHDVGLGVAAGYLRGDEVAARVRRNRVIFAGSSVVHNVEALKSVGKFTPELDGYTDHFSNLVLGLRHGLCYVPKLFSVARLARDSYSRIGGGPESRAALLALAEHLRSPEFADILPEFRRCAPISMFGPQLLGVALHNREHALLSPRLIGRGTIAAVRALFVKTLESIHLKGTARIIWYKANRYRPEQ